MDLNQPGNKALLLLQGMTIIMVVLKLVGQLAVSWWFVFLPLLFFAAVNIFYVVLAIAVLLFDRQKEKRGRFGG